MSYFNILKESKIEKTFRVAKIMSDFDLKIENLKEQFEGIINIENVSWQIGLIVGGSGTGKTTIAREVFKDKVVTNFNYEKLSVIDDMPTEKSVEDITKTFFLLVFLQFLVG